MFTVQELVTHTEWALLEAENERSKITEPIIFIPGMSSSKCRHFLNNICFISGARYLELGPWEGSTSISALYQNPLESYTLIDDWSMGPDNAPQTLNTNFNNVLGYLPNIIEDNCFSIDPVSKGIIDIDIIFCDTGADEGEQYSTLSYYYPYMSTNFVYILNSITYPPSFAGIDSAIIDNNITVNSYWTVQTAISSTPSNPGTTLYVGVFSK
jgi:hypothetical protein